MKEIPVQTFLEKRAYRRFTKQVDKQGRSIRKQLAIIIAEWTQAQENGGKK